MHFGIAHTPTPLLNHPDFHFSFGGRSGREIPLNEQSLLKTIESVAFPGSKFTIHENVSRHIVRAWTNEYPGKDVFVDQRFLISAYEEPEERKKRLPNRAALLIHLASLIGKRYVWGSNWPSGIPLLFEYYPPAINLLELNPLTRDTWQLRGVDCSGLLYYVTNGVTPRTTSELIAFGEPVPIENKEPDEIINALNPLDLIVWNGHVIVVLNQKQTIESLLGHGVVIQPLAQRIKELIDLKKKKPVNQIAHKQIDHEFVVRRWHPDCLNAKFQTV